MSGIRRFNPRQEAIYRSLVAGAWRKHAAINSIPEKDKIARDRWYREILVQQIGVHTSKQLDRGRDFARACAVFETLIGESIYWQMQVHDGSIRRARSVLIDLMLAHETEESYVIGIARQMGFPPNLLKLNERQLKAVTIALKKHLAVQESPETTPF